MQSWSCKKVRWAQSKLQSWPPGCQLSILQEPLPRVHMHLSHITQPQLAAALSCFTSSGLQRVSSAKSVSREGEARTISAPVAPVAVPVPRAVCGRPQGLLPVESVLQPVPSLHIAPSWEAQEPARQIVLLQDCSCACLRPQKRAQCKTSMQLQGKQAKMPGRRSKSLTGGFRAFSMSGRSHACLKGGYVAVGVRLQTGNVRHVSYRGCRAFSMSRRSSLKGHGLGTPSLMFSAGNSETASMRSSPGPCARERGT